MGTESGRAAALLRQARTLNLQTGNLLNWGRLRKKCPATPSEEVVLLYSGKIRVHKVNTFHNYEVKVLVKLEQCFLPMGQDYKGAFKVFLLRDCIQKTLNEWNSKISSDLMQEIPDIIDCTLPQAVEKINSEEREELKVSACSALGVEQLDSVIISPPPMEDGINFSLEYLQPYWAELENLVQNKKIVAIGTSDLDKTLLEQLFRWAQVKPSSNQVNLASCCVMPPDLTLFAKEFDIQLLTHNDPKELLCETDFREALQESFPDCQGHEWIPLWLLRYSVIVKSRGIIKSKGYILQAKRIPSS
ncbi:hypothetical protein Chor_003463 [Crotalus horridus]